MAKIPDVTITKLGTDFSITVTVHLTRRLRVRMLLARWLFTLAARVLGCRITVQDAPPEPRDHEH